MAVQDALTPVRDHVRLVATTAQVDVIELAILVATAKLMLGGKRRSLSNFLHIRQALYLLTFLEGHIIAI